jgi:hypothetical protein
MLSPYQSLIALFGDAAMNRRLFLQGSAAFTGCSAVGLTGCVHQPVAAPIPATPALPFYDAPGPIIPIRADVDRIFRITVCLRPFRAAGPRLEVERVGDKLDQPTPHLSGAIPAWLSSVSVQVQPHPPTERMSLRRCWFFNSNSAMSNCNLTVSSSRWLILASRSG